MEEINKNGALSSPASREASVSVKEIPDRKRKHMMVSLT